ncbi:MAG: helix-turn-helix transcriptional regulator, partial [Eubacterium sp.]|nr:helix-turn-helix transcriptional regulator [Eubacterium sp.]
FKTEIGENLSNYILKTKLELSKTLLLEGLDNAQISNALGFSSQSHFISVFKRQYGITPKKFIMEY